MRDLSRINPGLHGGSLVGYDSRHGRHFLVDMTFSRSLFQVSLLPASVVQFLVLKTRRSFSKPSIHLRSDLPFLHVPIGWALKTFFSGAVFVHSDNVACSFSSMNFD
ncbi:hypothetical protein TNCV_3659291 [Trichonephila clavipes]|nr:hypothetical protein TNCV_3659291 [Trichonephila clavipes]